MLILDDILLSPLNGFVWVAKKLYEAAEQELASEEQGITRELNEIYMMLETNQMSDQEFDLREAVLLDDLERLRDRSTDRDNLCNQAAIDGDDHRQAL